MGCALPEQCFNLLFLYPLAIVCFYNSWSSLADFSFTVDPSSIAVQAGAASTIFAAVGFSAMLGAECCQCGSINCILGILCSILSVVNAICYFAWGYYGKTGNFCSSASSLTGKISESSAFNCDTSWITFAIWAWLSISGSLQLSIAFSAVSCSGGSISNSLPKLSRSLSKNGRRTRRPRSTFNSSQNGKETDNIPLRTGRRHYSSSGSDSDVEGGWSRKF